MQIIVELDYSQDSANNFELLKVKTLKEYYKKFYQDKDNNIILDEELEVIYYETEIPFMPIEGQRVGTKFGVCIVTHSYYEFEPTDYYYNKTRIVVREE